MFHQMISLKIKMHHYQPPLSKWHNDIISIIWQLCLGIWEQIRVRAHNRENDGEKTAFTCRKCLLRYHISIYFCASKYLPAPSFPGKFKRCVQGKKEGDNGAHLWVITCQLEWTDHLAEKKQKKQRKTDYMIRYWVSEPARCSFNIENTVFLHNYLCYGCKTKIEM